MRPLALAALLLAGLAFAAPSKGSAQAKELATEADKLYKDNKYAEAAAKLQQAYDAEPNPTYIYNIARAWDQAGELQKALDTYRQYVAQPSDQTKPDLVRKANLAMDRLRTLVAKAEADKQVQAAEKQRLEDEANKARERADAEADAARLQREALAAKDKAAREDAEKKSNSQKIVAYTVGGVGVAALGTSLALAFVTQGAKNQYTQATTLEQKDALKGQVQTLAAVTDVVLVVGVAAAVTAIILYPKGGEAPKGSVSVALVPLSGGGAFASVGASF
jgi:tetratricopeptide (TPR) repeat protein